MACSSTRRMGKSSTGSTTSLVATAYGLLPSGVAGRRLEASMGERACGG